MSFLTNFLGSAPFKIETWSISGSKEVEQKKGERKKDKDGYFVEPWCDSNKNVFKVRYKEQTYGEAVSRAPKVPEEIVSEENFLDTIGLGDLRAEMDEQHNRMLRIRTDLYNRINRLMNQIDEPYNPTYEDEIEGNPYENEGKGIITSLDEKKAELKRLKKVLSSSPLRDDEYRRTAKKLLDAAQPIYNGMYADLQKELAKEVTAFNKAVDRYNTKRDEITAAIRDLKSAYNDATSSKFGVVKNGGLVQPIPSARMGGVDVEYMTFDQAFRKYADIDAAAEDSSNS